MYFHVLLPPKRKDTSAKPARSTRRATTEATAGVHIRAQTHEKLPVLMMIAWKTAESTKTMAKYMPNPRRAWSRAGEVGCKEALAAVTSGLLFRGTQCFTVSQIRGYVYSLKLKLHWTPPGGAREFALIGKRVASIHEVRGRVFSEVGLNPRDFFIELV